MRRGTIFIGLFILIAVGIIVCNGYICRQPPLDLTVAVDPLAYAWAQDALNAYNATSPTLSGRRVQFKLVLTDDVAVWNGQQNWKPENHPDGWIAASSLSVKYAAGNGLPLVILGLLNFV